MVISGFGNLYGARGLFVCLGTIDSYATDLCEVDDQFVNLEVLPEEVYSTHTFVFCKLKWLVSPKVELHVYGLGSWINLQRGAFKLAKG